MIYTILALVIAAIAAGGIYAALRLMFNSEWLAGWLRGNAYLLLLGVTLLLLLAAQDLQHYRILSSGTILATVTLVEKSPQDFLLTLTEPNGSENAYEIHGDQWEVDLRILRWSSHLTVLGFLPGYRLNEIRTRFFSIADERKYPALVVELDASRLGFDVWKLIERYGAVLPLSAATDAAAFLPLKHGAIFQIVMNPTGIAAKPINDAAKSAMQGWE